MLNNIFKAALAVLLLLLFQSCTTPQMHTSYANDQKHVAMASGQWLLNNINFSAATSGWIKGKMESLVKDALQKRLGARLTFIDDARGKILLPNTGIMELEPKDLRMLKATTGFDYLINISAEEVTLNQGIDKLTGYPLDNSEMRIFLHVYDLQTQMMVHSQLVRTYTDKMGQRLYETNEKLYIPTLKKALKNLLKHSGNK
jgi:hypothetical protein